MKPAKKLQILDSIGKVYEKSKDCKLENDFLLDMKKELTLLSKYFKTNDLEAFFISLIFAYNCKNDSVGFQNLENHLDCNPMKMMEFFQLIEHLTQLNYLSKGENRWTTSKRILDCEFFVNESLVDAVLRNQPMPELKHKKSIDVLDVLEKLEKLASKVSEEELNPFALKTLMKEMLAENSTLSLIQFVLNLEADDEDRFIYLYLIYKTVSGNKSIFISHVLELIYESYSQRFIAMDSLQSQENILIKNGLVELVEAHFVNDSEIKLTLKSLKILADFGIKLVNLKFKQDNIFDPKDIAERILFFSESKMSQLLMLENLLMEEKFQSVQKRLTDKNLPKGVTVLLYGSPGTGKTEIVKQWARSTNRQLMKVEISQSKSMWFGESEKKIKKIFTDYKSFAEDCEQTPILLFNEADAILSKRKENGNSSVSQTENTIQNILLEEIENFEGILVATTNIAKNLDSAFERRFLFKVQFSKPSFSERVKIWNSKMPILNIEDCETLARSFQFSGGQIENIVRKKEIHEIIHDAEIDFEMILSFCQQEVILGDAVNVVGFKASVAC